MSFKEKAMAVAADNTKPPPGSSPDAYVDEDEQGLDLPKRETWTRKIDFLLACVGFSVGLGNIWRFPYLCYKNGGGAFLIPYLICVIVGGIPLFYLEVALGQFMSRGGIKAWKICPIFEGIGWSTTAIVFYLNCYYNVILAWAFYYLFATIYYGVFYLDDLPWTTCDNDWNTPSCTLNFGSDTVDNITGTTMMPDGTTSGEPVVALDATTEFWEYKVLGISSGVDEIGEIKWDICICLLVAWIVVYLCIIKGIKSSGKVMYVTATSPYIFMLILLIRAAFLPGAKKGLEFYMVPDWEKMKDMQVWVDAGTQIFFSYSISLGALTALGSYNEFNHNSYRDSILFACTNSGTSIFGGFVIFMTLGFMSEQQGIPIQDVAESGPGLAFIAYPKAVSTMPISPLWAILFFIMVILLGLDSQFVGVEGLVTSLVDAFPWLRKSPRRELFTGFACIIQFLVGLSMVTNGGMFIFQLLDYYSGSKIILFVAFFMCVAIAYIYGVNRFYDNIEMMMGYRISPYMKICWLSFSPIFCMAVFVMSVIEYSELTYGRPTGVYVYPEWAVIVGWMLAASTAIWIPITAIYKMISYTCKGKPLSDLLKPEGLKPHQLRPQDMADEYAMQGKTNQAYSY